MRFETIGADLDPANLAKHNRNLVRADADLTSLQQQVRTEQQARITAVNAHIQAIAAHAASAITLATVSGMSAKTVQAAIAELRNILTTIIAGPAPSAAEIQAARVGADNVARASLDILIKEIHAKQLDTQQQQATLQRGVNIVNSDQASGASFKVQGRTLVNLLGRDGGFEVESTVAGVGKGWTKSSTGAYSLVNSGGLRAQRIASLTTDEIQFSRRVDRGKVKVEAGKHYICIARATVENGRALLRVDHSTETYVESGSSLGGLLYLKFTPTSNVDAMVRLYNSINLGEVGYVQFEGVRLYEVTAADYAALGTSITGDAIDARWPYVDSLQPLQGVSVLMSGKNLLHGIPDSIHTNAIINGLYDFTHNPTTGSQLSYFSVKVNPNTTYTFSVVLSGGSAIRVYINNSVSSVNNIAALSTDGQQTITFNSGNNRVLYIMFSAVGSTGSFSFKNWMLVLGDTSNLPASFEPYVPQYAHCPTPLHSNADRSIADSYDSTTGQVFRRWRTGVKLDGSLPWVSSNSGDGKRYIIVDNSSFIPSKLELAGNHQVIRYDGKVIFPQRAPFNIDLVDSSWSSGSTGIGLVISHSDSGWSNNITPNANARKALMNGWKANGNDGSVYNSWVSILTSAAPTTNAEAYVANNKAPGWDCYATLNYVMATPIVEQLTGDLGAISVEQGGNLVELLEGVILRETVVPQASGGNHYINRTSVPLSLLKSRPRRIIGIFKDGLIDTSWTVSTNAIYDSSLGAFKASSDFDPSAEYHVSYEILDKYAYTANAVDATLEYQSTQGSVIAQNVQDIAAIKTHDSVQDWILAQHTARLLALEEA